MKKKIIFSFVSKGKGKGHSHGSIQKNRYLNIGR